MSASVSSLSSNTLYLYARECIYFSHPPISAGRAVHCGSHEAFITSRLVCTWSALLARSVIRLCFEVKCISQQRTRAFLHTQTNMHRASLIAGMHPILVLAALNAAVLSPRKAICRWPGINHFCSRSNTAAADASNYSVLMDSRPDWINSPVIVAHTSHASAPKA